jgi:DNA invertase Pin-like site-specific DNA recombinase
VNWRSFTEEFLDSTGVFRDAIIAILAAIAKQERTRRSERASAAVQRLRRQGKTDHLGRNRVLVGHKLERIRQLHEEGLSLRAIGKQLNVSPMTVLRALAGCGKRVLDPSKTASAERTINNLRRLVSAEKGFSAAC